MTVYVESGNERMPVQIAVAMKPVIRARGYRGCAGPGRTRSDVSHHPQQSVLNPQAGHRQTACILNISSPQRSQCTASTFGRLTVVDNVRDGADETDDFGMSGL